MGDTKGCEYIIPEEQSSGMTLDGRCGKPAGFGMTRSENRYAIWLCKLHVPMWLADNGLKLNDVLGNKPHTPAPVTVPDEPTGEFPALPEAWKSWDA